MYEPTPPSTLAKMQLKTRPEDGMVVGATAPTTLHADEWAGVGLERFAGPGRIELDVDGARTDALTH